MGCNTRNQRRTKPARRGKSTRKKQQRKIQDGFQVGIPSERGDDKMEVKESPFKLDGNCEVAVFSYVIEPFDRWKSMERPGMCQLTNDVTLSENTFIYVRSGKSKQWIAYILDIRAADEKNMFALVCWMYFPEDLPAGTRYGDTNIKGRQPYHGHRELIASNHMDVINIHTIEGPAHVVQQQNPNKDITGHYWRFFYDSRKSTLNMFPGDTMVACGECHRVIEYVSY
ncbi:hypothetical protein S40288_06003 [Stachybotrys chartarum IBT 40288]|nr:hypothetical protein S40288_06003 [Stachybotrys chartarum IBT 40288]